MDAPASHNPGRIPGRLNPRRILVLSRNQIGDCVLTTPMLRALRRGFPEARLAVSIPASNRELLARNPNVDEIVERPRRSSWGAKIRFAREVRRRGEDLIISLQEKSLFYAWLTAHARTATGGKPVTIALDHPRTRRWYGYTSPVLEDRHEVDKNLAIARMLGCAVEDYPRLELFPSGEARERVARLLDEEGFGPDARFLGINPGATKAEKRWAPERFAQAAERVCGETGLPALVLGGPGDVELAERIAAGMTRRPVIAAGRLSLGQTAAMLERCRLLLTGDTGPMHMAVAVGTPVVALFGPTNPLKFGPYTDRKELLRHEKPCRACRKPCLHTVTAEECAEAALRLCSDALAGAAK